MNPQVYLTDDQVIETVNLDADNRNVVMGWRGQTSAGLVRPRLWLPVGNISPSSPAPSHGSVWSLTD